MAAEGCFFIEGTQAFDSAQADFRLVLMTLFQSSSDISSMGAPSHTPALQTSRSMRPHWSSVCFTISWAPAYSDTSAWTVIARTPLALHNFWVSRASASLLR